MSFVSGDVEFPPAPDPSTSDPDDENRGRFGEKSTDKGVRLSARLNSTLSRKSFFVFDAMVRPIKSNARIRPIGPAKFFLHHTFPSTAIVIRKPKPDGSLVLEEISAIGTFVLGCQVQVSPGNWALLEYDVAKLTQQGVPKYFVGR